MRLIHTFWIYKRTSFLAALCIHKGNCDSILNDGIDCLLSFILSFPTADLSIRMSAFPLLYLSVHCFFSPDGLGTSPALCHMISLQAAGVKLIWSGLKAYKRLMLHINCSHLNSRLPSLKCPACPRFVSNSQILSSGKQNEVLCLCFGINKTNRCMKQNNKIKV